ncbi:Hypothetical protein FKW44_020459, partial [Caligus rogercresseyi]
AVQFAINDAARSIVGCKDGSQPHRGSPLESRPSLPQRAWKCFYSNDGAGCARNPVGDFVFPIPMRPMRFHDSRAYFCMPRNISVNLSKALRSATTLHTARTAARAI